jgi:hypothetical protein
MSRPDPMPVEVTSEFAVEADELVELDAAVFEVVDDVVVGVVEVAPEIVELMSLYVLSQVANLSAAGT